MARDQESIKERIQFIKVEGESVATKLADKLMVGEILCLNFNDCPLDEAKTVLHFLSGVNYATDGMIKQMEKNTFLIGLKEHFKDPQVKEFLLEFTKKK